MATVEKRLLSAAEYLAQERLAEFRSEYFRGETFAMAGGTPRHSRIKTNFTSALNTALKGKPCTPYDSDLRIRISATGLYTYPDASVFCDELQYDDEQGDTVLNPTLLAEVLSKSSEAYDRGWKFENYRQLPSLKAYLLLSQDCPRLELFTRNPDGSWTPTVVTGLDQSLQIPAIGVTLTLAELYEKVDFGSKPD